MKCETIRNMISSYIDKDLNAIEKTELEKHLTDCKECREEYESMLDIIAVCGNLEEVELPQNFRTELHQRLVEEKKKKNFFGSFLGNKNMRMTTGLVAAALVIAIGIGSLPQLFNNNVNMSQGASPSPWYGAATAPAAPPVDMDANSLMKKDKMGQPEMAAADQPQITYADDSGAARNSVGMEFSESILAGKVAPGQGVEGSRSGRMVIRTGNMSVNVASVDKATTDIKQLTEGSGGYVENSQIDNITIPPVQDVNGSTIAKEVTEKYANMTVRVPEDKFESIFNSIKGMGKLVSENTNGSDITAEYRDTAVRVDNLKIQEQSLQQLMPKAKNIDEILRIETELNRVRTDIDLYSGNLKRWDNLVQLSTINIYLKELKPEELKSVDVSGMWGKAYQGFIKAINNIVLGLEKTVIVLVAAIPYLLVAGVLGLIGLLVSRKIKLKKKQ